MGLDVNGVKLLLYASRIGVNFQNTVTLGRQELHLTKDRLFRQILLFGLKITDRYKSFESAYCEPFLELLGAQDTQSIDYSAYESATIVHDMNRPITETLKRKFSVVIDAGTLEHVFNYPVAIKNCMELLQAGGHFISITPANNFMGHGFYQFSPELFFSVFKLSNGFEIVKLLVCENYDGAQWYKVSKSKGDLSGRVTLVNHRPVYMMCIARRLDDMCEPFKTTPQQSGYIEAWTQTDKPPSKSRTQTVNRFDLFKNAREILRSVPFFRSLVFNIRYLRKPVFSLRDYTPLNPIAEVKRH